jgi:hypothetical protein
MRSAARRRSVNRSPSPPRGAPAGDGGFGSPGAGSAGMGSSPGSTSAANPISPEVAAQRASLQQKLRQFKTEAARVRDSILLLELEQSSAVAAQVEEPSEEHTEGWETAVRYLQEEVDRARRSVRDEEILHLQARIRETEEELDSLRDAARERDVMLQQITHLVTTYGRPSAIVYSGAEASSRSSSSSASREGSGFGAMPAPGSLGGSTSSALAALNDAVSGAPAEPREHRRGRSRTVALGRERDLRPLPFQTAVARLRAMVSERDATIRAMRDANAGQCREACSLERRAHHNFVSAGAVHLTELRESLSRELERRVAEARRTGRNADDNDIQLLREELADVSLTLRGTLSALQSTKAMLSAVDSQNWRTTLASLASALETRDARIASTWREILDLRERLRFAVLIGERRHADAGAAEQHPGSSAEAGMAADTVAAEGAAATIGLAAYEYERDGDEARGGIIDGGGGGASGGSGSIIHRGSGGGKNNNNNNNNNNNTTSSSRALESRLGAGEDDDLVPAATAREVQQHLRARVAALRRELMLKDSLLESTLHRTRAERGAALTVRAALASQERIRVDEIRAQLQYESSRLAEIEVDAREKAELVDALLGGGGARVPGTDSGVGAGGPDLQMVPEEPEMETEASTTSAAPAANPTDAHAGGGMQVRALAQEIAVLGERRVRQSEVVADLQHRLAEREASLEAQLRDADSPEVAARSTPPQQRRLDRSEMTVRGSQGETGGDTLLTSGRARNAGSADNDGGGGGGSGGGGGGGHDDGSDHERVRVSVRDLNHVIVEQRSQIETLERALDAATERVTRMRAARHARRSRQSFDSEGGTADAARRKSSVGSVTCGSDDHLDADDNNMPLSPAAARRRRNRRRRQRRQYGVDPATSLVIAEPLGRLRQIPSDELLDDPVR